MSQKVDEFCENLRVKLTGMESRMRELMAKIDHDREATKAAIDEKIDEAGAGLRAAKDDAEAARQRMKVHLEETTAESEYRIAEWKHHRDVSKLERRAEDLEAYATWAMMVAADAIEEADLATLKAIAARLDAEYAAAS